MRIGLILFFILMPLVFKGLEVLFDEFEPDYTGYWIYQALQLLFYYGIEVFYVMAHHSITGEWMFKKGNQYPDAFPSFVFLAVVYIVVAVGAKLVTIEDCGEILAYDIGNTISLLVLFALYMIFIAKPYIKDTTDQIIFNQMPYQVTAEETINLRAFSDTHTTSGNIRGSRFYINGEIRDNYELYYCFLAEDDSLAIKHFTYTEAHCKIFPEENCTNPRLEITTYGKEYKSYNDYYSDYVLHIPKNETFGTGINME